ncbi:VOC family protein [Caulobacter mirabilis]|nr:VOC family protein [Caulobacter mirabilis]
MRVIDLIPTLAAACAAGLLLTGADPARAMDKKETPPMRVADAYPLITTSALAATRDFHVRHLGATVVFEASWFVMLQLPAEDGGRPFTVAYMTPEHPSTPPGPEAFDGKGMILTLQVASADKAHTALKAGGAPIVYGPADEPWGQRRFMTRDPAGVLIDVVEQTQPQAGFWERYGVKAD